MLLGSEAVGKTTLLCGLSEAVQQKYQESLITVNLSSLALANLRLAALICARLASVGVTLSMSEFLKEIGTLDQRTLDRIAFHKLNVYDLLLMDLAEFEACGISACSAHRLKAAATSPPLFTRISQALEKNDKFLFVILDNFHLVYSSAVPHGHAIRDLIAIGDDLNGRIHCIISGRSAHLRRLAASARLTLMKSAFSPTIAPASISMTQSSKPGGFTHSWIKIRFASCTTLAIDRYSKLHCLSLICAR